MHWQGINANIMSLGGIAIAIGAMVDAAIVMIENAHKHLERWRQENIGQVLSNEQHWKLISKAACEVGPALFFSLLIITLSFLPVFTLQAQEGRLFSPLAFTKTYAMAAAAGLSVTLVPVLMGYFIRGKIPDEKNNPVSRWLIKSYQPLLQIILQAPKRGMLLAFVLLLSTLYPLSELGSEFMPEMYEGDLMYMPTTLPGLSIGKAQQLLQQTDRLIASVHEVKQVFGKIGRADTATDPAPLTMIETLIQLKPRDEWRQGMTLEKLIEELDNTVKFPGLTNAWLMPIKTRIDMLSTGIKTPVGVKVSGPDLKVIEKIGRDIEKQLMKVHGTVSAYSERITGGRYIEVVPDRDKAAHLGINIKVINDVIRAAVGGINVTSTVEGLERYPVNIRFAREVRDDIEKLREIPLLTPTGMEVALGQVAEISIVDGPPVLKSENARLNGWTFVDIRGVDLGGYVQQAQKFIANNVKLPAGYSISWAGQYEYLLRAREKLYQVVPITLMIIFLLLYLTFKRIEETLIVMLTLPFALIVGYWLMFVLGYNMSVASAVGFIALAGVAAEFGVIMLIYLNNVAKERALKNELNTPADLRSAIIEGAVMRVRPKAMTVAVIIAGLIPVMIGSGAGSEVMQRIAAPMIGGMITAPLLSLFIIPAVYYLWQSRVLNNRSGSDTK